MCKVSVAKLNPNASFWSWTIKRGCGEVHLVTDAVPVFHSKTHSQGQYWSEKAEAQQREGCGFGIRMVILRLSLHMWREEKNRETLNIFPPRKEKINVAGSMHFLLSISIMWQNHRKRQVIEKAIFRQQLCFINGCKAFQFVTQTHIRRHTRTHAHTHTHRDIYNMPQRDPPLLDKIIRGELCFLSSVLFP